MNAPWNTRLELTRGVLWLLLGVGMALAVARYTLGLGATTALSDMTPWGLWIGFDVLSGVALAAGGFVLAATVYIFRLERYRPMVRPAVLTAFLGYIAVALGLMMDLGRPWNIWRAIFFWQVDSPLFEVAWCVMLYLTVLALEFAPVFFQGLKWNRAYRFMHKFTLPLVIAGIALSTLHQSSLGTLFLLARDRIHPLWDSPLQPLLFFVSAVALGLVMVTSESFVSSWVFKREAEWPLMRGLTRAAAIVLGLYLAIRLVDLGVHGSLVHLLDGSWPSMLFLVEIAMSSVIPIVLFTLPATRNTRGGIAGGAMLSVGGLILNRADVGGIAHIPITGHGYFPALTEILMSVGLVSGMALIFLYFVERFPVWEEMPDQTGHHSQPTADPVTRVRFGGNWLGPVRLGAAAWVVGAIAGIVILEVTMPNGEAPKPVDIRQARSVAAVRTADGVVDVARVSRDVAAQEPFVPEDEGFTTALLIDGDRAGWSVVFDHMAHRDRLGGEASCVRCHHRNAPLDRGTPCSTCHSDMYACSDTFDHDTHIAALDGNDSCERCHAPGEGALTRAASTPCRECHDRDIHHSFGPDADDRAEYARLAGPSCVGCHGVMRFHGFDERPAQGEVDGIAPGYRHAMHRLCIDCHAATEATKGVETPTLSRCAACHPRISDEEAAAGLRPGMVARLEMGR